MTLVGRLVVAGAVATLIGFGGCGAGDEDPASAAATSAAAVAAESAPTASSGSAYTARGIGLVGGIGSALVLLLLFRKFWFDPERYLWPRTVGALTEAEASKLGSLALGSELGNEPSRAASDFSQFKDTPTTMPPHVAQVVKVRCPYCAALLDERDHTCHKCGGGQ